ncbi:MAG: phage holin family protein [Patescibacteria group bacterium]|nr:phage holin family protein [Patescibacteria group bacterium]
MEILISWLLAGLVVLVSAYLLSGISVSGFVIAFLVALALGLLNAFLKPILILLTLPINILTLGLFTLVINAFLIMLVAVIVPGFKVETFWWAFLFGIMLSVVNWLVNLIFS